MAKFNYTVLYKGNVYGNSITLIGANTIVGNLIKMEQYKLEDFEIVEEMRDECVEKPWREIGR